MMSYDRLKLWVSTAWLKLVQKENQRSITQFSVYLQFTESLPHAGIRERQQAKDFEAPPEESLKST